MKRPLLVLLPLFGFLSLYLITLTGVHTYDALSYILDVDRKPWPELFHPHHLAYGPFGWLIRNAALSLGYRGSAEVLLQAANALAGAGGTALFGWIVARAVGDDRWGLLGAGLLGSSYAYWYYAIEVEVYTIAAFFLIATLGLLLAVVQRPAWRLALLLGVMQGLATLFHQTNVLLGLPILIALLIGAGSGPGLWRRRVGLLAAYGLPAALIIGVSYLWVGVVISGFRDWQSLYRWAAGYTTTGWWGGPIDGNTWAELAQGLSETLARPGGGLAWLGLGLLALLSWRAAAQMPRAIVAVLLGWLLLYGGFFAWWEADNIEFWIASLPPFYLLLIMIAARSSWPQIAQGVALLLVLGMLISNGLAIARRGDPARDLQRQIAEALIARTNPGDLLVLPDGLLELYLPFYGGREQVAALTWAMLPGDGWEAACGRLQGRIELALASGYAVLIAEEARRPLPAAPGEPPTMMERFGLTPDQIAACYEPYSAAAQPIDLGLRPELAYTRIAGAQELAQGDGWDFRQSSWGWQAARADTLARDGAGWLLRPGDDPALSSPPFQIAAEDLQAIEIRLAADTAARDAQIFFRDAAGDLDETRSLRFTLQPGAAAHTYRLELPPALRQQGLITGLRIDPVGVGDGGTIRLEWLKLR